MEDFFQTQMCIVDCGLWGSDNKLEMNFLTFIYCYSWLIQYSAYNHAEIQKRRLQGKRGKRDKNERITKRKRKNDYHLYHIDRRIIKDIQKGKCIRNRMGGGEKEGWLMGWIIQGRRDGVEDEGVWGGRICTF